MTTVNYLLARDGSLDLEGLERLGLGATVLDLDCRVVWMNTAARRLLGVERAAPEKRYFADLLPMRTEGLLEAQFEKVLKGRAAHARFANEVSRSEGVVVLVKEVAIPLYDDRQIVGLLVFSIPLEPPARVELPARLPRLTSRQHQVLRLMASGLAARQVGRELGVSYQTARNHVRHVQEVLGVRSSVEAIVVATRLGLVDDVIV